MVVKKKMLTKKPANFAKFVRHSRKLPKFVHLPLFVANPTAKDQFINQKAVTIKRTFLVYAGTGQLEQDFYATIYICLVINAFLIEAVS